MTRLIRWITSLLDDLQATRFGRDGLPRNWRRIGSDRGKLCLVRPDDAQRLPETHERRLVGAGWIPRGVRYELGVNDAPIQLRDVKEIAQQAREVVARFERENSDILRGEVHHMGATAMPFGHTKGDVDVNVRVEQSAFARLVDALREGFDVAQPENWTPTFASFSSDRYPLPFGIQVTVMGSPDDFLLTLRDRMLADHDLLREYDRRKLGAAAAGADAYWDAKNAFLREVLAE